MNITNGSWLFAILLSIGSAYYSITGLLAMFPAMGLGLVLLASMIEASKLWSMHSLISRWNKIGIWFKTMFFSLIFCLSILTSIGVYGHLSNGHSQQLLPQAENTLLLNQYSMQKNQLDSELAILYDRQNSLNKIELAQLSGNVISKNRTPLLAERKELKLQIESIISQQRELSVKLLELSKTKAKTESELGPIKYFADLVGLDSDNAIKLIIILIMLGLEPMILSHVIMASYKDNEPVVEKPVIETIQPEVTKPNIVEDQMIAPIKKKRGPYKKKNIVDEPKSKIEPVVELLHEPIKVGTYADIKKKIAQQ